MSIASLPSHEIWTLPTRHLGQRVCVFRALDSTNSTCLSLGQDLTHHGLVLLADEQSAGRGQYGRTWQAPPGSSVLMSLLLFPPPHLCRPAILTAWAAVGVAELILEITGRESKIKWPNDVYLDGKKVCGILIEQRSGGRAELPPATVVGIGLNVNQPAEFFERSDLRLGGSLFSLAGRYLDHRDVARRLIQGLDVDFDRLTRGDLITLEGAWRGRLGLLGRSVRVETGSEARHGKLRTIGFEAVELDVGDAKPLRLIPESVRQIRALESVIEPALDPTNG